MPEGSRTPKRTTGEATREKKNKKRPRQRVRKLEKVYVPRIWGWVVMILLLLQFIGFCTCQPPSAGWYYRRRLINYLSMTFIPLCWQMLSSYLSYFLRVTIPEAFGMVLKCWTWSQGRDIRVDLLSCISYLGSLLWYGFSKYLLPVIFILCNGGSRAIALLYAWDPRAILLFVIVFGILAFWKRSKLKGQLARAKLTIKTSINKIRLQSTFLWLLWMVKWIAILMTVLFLALVCWFGVVDREGFWEWTEGAR